MHTQDTHKSPLQRIWNLIQSENRNIKFLYTYAIISGAISLVLPLGIQALMSLVLGGQLTSGWYILVIIITVAVFIAGLTRLAQMSILETIQQRLFVNTAFEFSRRIVKADLKSKKHAGVVELSEKFLDVITVQKSFSKLILDFSASLLQIIFGLILLIVYHPLFIFFGVVVAATVSLVLRLTWNRGIQSARVESDYKFKTAYWLIEIAQNRSIFKLKSKDSYHLYKTDEYLHGYLKGRKDHFKILYRQSYIAILIKVVLTSSLIILGSILLVNQSISLGQFLASEILIVTLLSAVEKVILTVENIYDSGIALEKLGYITDAPLEKSAEDIKHFKSEKNPELVILSKENQTELLRIKSGEKVGICGIPGSGRTRVLRTLTGEVQPDWHTLINQVPVENIDTESLGEITGLCLQGSDVFEDSLARNIALGETMDMEELAQLASVLNLQRFINAIPGGYMHTIDAGIGLPTNIMRKIVLARALYHKPKLLLIDDIWSVFNREEIEQVMQYLVSLDCTLVVISNYAPVLKHTERFCYMEESSFTDYGKFSETSVPQTIKPVIWL